MAGLCAPLPTLRLRPRELQTHGLGPHVDPLLLHRIGLAPITPCRSPGAQSPQHHQEVRASSRRFPLPTRKASAQTLKTSANAGRECPRRLSMREGRAPQAREPPHLWLHLQKVKRSKVERAQYLPRRRGSSDFADADRLWDPTRDPTDRRPLPGSRIRRDFAQWKWGRVAGQNDDAARRICFDLVAVEPITEADVENAGHDRVDAGSSGCLWDISFHAGGL